MPDHGTEAALGVAHNVRQLNWRCPRVVTELVSVSPGDDQDEIALLESDGISLALNLHAASSALYHVKMRKNSSGEAQRPRSRKLTSAKEPAP
jgi:hypothetical protein